MTSTTPYTLRKRVPRAAAALLFLPLPLAGCFGGSDDDDGEGSAALMCNAVEGCGGDLVGLWDVQSVCVSDAPQEHAECEGMITRSTITAVGTVEFTADGGLQLDYVIEEPITYRFTTACVAAELDMEVTVDDAFCSEIESNLTADGTEGSCAVQGDACVCEARHEQAVQGASTYTLEGDSLIGADNVPNPYCVEGRSMRISFESAAGIVGFRMQRAD